MIAGDIDLDNVDNVFRMAYHLGITIDKQAPVRIARAIVSFPPDRREPVFETSAQNDIEAWREIRRNVYEHLMLAERDFVGKIMMLSAAVGAYEASELRQSDWSLVDYQLITLLLKSEVKEVKDTVERWIAGELWDCTPLHWMAGERPDYVRLRAFWHELSAALGRPCFAYGIKDKLDRQLVINFDDGSRRTYGTNPKQWLLGIGSSRRETFSPAHVDRAFALAADTFSTHIVAPAAQKSEAQEAQACLSGPRPTVWTVSIGIFPTPERLAAPFTLCIGFRGTSFHNIPAALI